MILDDLADILSSASLGAVGTSIFKGEAPSTPDEIYSLYSYGGGAPERTMGRGPGTALLERPRFQVAARANDPTSAEKKARDAWFTLDELYDVTKNGRRYLYVQALQSPFFLHRDQTGRYIFVCNYEAVCDAVSSS